MLKRQIQIDALADAIKAALVQIYGEELGFALFMFPMNGEGKAGDYVSNAQRPTMVKFMREIADRLEKHESIGRVIGEA